MRKVPLSVCHPLCGSFVEHAGGPAESFAGVSPPSPSPGAKTGLNTTHTHTHTRTLHSSCDTASHVQMHLALAFKWKMVWIQPTLCPNTIPPFFTNNFAVKQGLVGNLSVNFNITCRHQHEGGEQGDLVFREVHRTQVFPKLEDRADQVVAACHGGDREKKKVGETEQ